MQIKDLQNISRQVLIESNKKTKYLYRFLERKSLFSSVGLEHPSHTRKVTGSSPVAGKINELC